MKRLLLFKYTYMHIDIPTQIYMICGTLCIQFFKTLFEKNSSAAKNTHGNFWPGISKVILNSASQSSHSLTKIVPLVTFSSVHLKGKFSSCLQLPQEPRDEPPGLFRVIVAHSFCQSLTWLFGGHKIRDYADPSPQSLLMTVSSSESHSIYDSANEAESASPFSPCLAQCPMLQVLLAMLPIGLPIPCLWTLGWKWIPGIQAAPQCRTCLLESFP